MKRFTVFVTGGVFPLPNGETCCLESGIYGGFRVGSIGHIFSADGYSIKVLFESEGVNYVKKVLESSKIENWPEGTFEVTMQAYRDRSIFFLCESDKSEFAACETKFCKNARYIISQSRLESQFNWIISDLSYVAIVNDESAGQCFAAEGIDSRSGRPFLVAYEDCMLIDYSGARPNSSPFPDDSYLMGKTDRSMTIKEKILDAKTIYYNNACFIACEVDNAERRFGLYELAREPFVHLEKRGVYAAKFDECDSLATFAAIFKKEGLAGISSFYDF